MATWGENWSDQSEYKRGSTAKEFFTQEAEKDSSEI